MKKKYSKRFKKIIELKDGKKSIAIDEAIKKVKANCTTKFNESIDISCKLNLKQKKDDIDSELPDLKELEKKIQKVQKLLSNN